MRRFFLSLTALVPVVLLSACGGNNAATGSLPGQPQAQQHYTVASLSHDTHRHHTPARPPKPRHHITAADRARARAGGWTALTGVPNFPNGAGQEIMMTDGTIMVADNCSALWYSYAPDINGNYANGTWTQKAAPSYAPLYFASAVLTDGKLIINGGEYDQCVGKETTKGAIYDPIANTWADVSPPSGWGQIGDAQSVILNDGTYMIGNCCTSAQAQYDESTGAWTAVGTGKHDSNSEEGWTLLANGTVADIKVAGFSSSAASDFTLALKKSVDAGVKNIVLDLRDDPGGFVEAALSIADQFVASGPIYWEEDSQGVDQAHNATGTGVAIDPSIKVAVLVNGGTASASEIVTGALHDTGRATVIGTKTYGKGTIQQWILLSNDSGGFRLSTDKWLTPDKTWIHGVGITPDQVVDKPADLPINQDPQMDRALADLAGPVSTCPACALSTPAPTAPAPSPSPSGGPAGSLDSRLAPQIVIG